MTIQGSLYWIISLLKRCSAAKVVKIASKNCGFSEI